MSETNNITEAQAVTLNHRSSFGEQAQKMGFDLVYLALGLLLLSVVAKRAINYSYERADQHVARSIHAAQLSGVPFTLNTAAPAASHLRGR